MSKLFKRNKDLEEKLQDLLARSSLGVRQLSGMQKHWGSHDLLVQWEY